MTRLDTKWELGDMPDFDPIEMKRRIQAEIYEETKHMTPAQRQEHTRQASERMRKKREQYWAEQTAKAESASR